MQLLARALRYVANKYLADPDPERANRNQSKQNTARANAAEASATLRQRRHDRDEVDAYLQTRPHGDERAG